ncbi:amidohydrolase family protein [Hymenobacter cellulosilyticus]|uniref:amidohydrolase family protein n=1 Tax=Hymenobacter cellulosilyticus TaxID=2932248 RepID=UPI0035CB1A88
MGPGHAAAGLPAKGGHSGGPGLRRTSESFSEHHVGRHYTQPPSEAITRQQAVQAYTYGSAFAEFEEKSKGRLAVGQLADLVVLSQDIFTVPPRSCPKPAVC